MTWTAKIGLFEIASITKYNNEYNWSVCRESLDFGFGDCSELEMIISGKADSLKEAKRAIMEYKKK